MNPWDLNAHRIPGGSSSGTAVAVAANMAPCGMGSDTGGSVRLPAAYCGVVGLKVTAGRLPLHGVMPLSQTLDTPGPITQTVLDCLIMFDVLDGREGWQIRQDLEKDDGIYALLSRGVAGLRLGCLTDSERQQCKSAQRCTNLSQAEVRQPRNARPSSRRLRVPLAQSIISLPSSPE